MNLLPGWNPGFIAGGGGAALTEITFVGTTTSVDSADVIGSASIVAGDILVLIDSVWVSGTPPASSVPSGFNQISTTTLGGSSNARTTLSYKIATGAEASATITGMSGAGGGSGKVLMVFRPDATLVSITPLDISTEVTDGNPSAQTITASTGPAPLIVIGAYAASGNISPRTFTVGGIDAKDGEGNAQGSARRVWLAYKIYNSSPADVIIDMDDELSDNALHGCYLSAA